MFKIALLATLLVSTPVLYAKERILLHRIGPSDSTLFVAKTDGSGERSLLPSSGFDYNASFSADSKWIIFTSERGGSADIYRVHPDGSDLERLTDNPAYDDQAALSPDGKQLAFGPTNGNAGTDGTFPSLLPGNAGETWEKPGKPGGNLGTGNLGTDRKPGRNLGTDRPFSRLICDVAAVQCY